MLTAFLHLLQHFGGPLLLLSATLSPTLPEVFVGFDEFPSDYHVPITLHLNASVQYVRLFPSDDSSLISASTIELRS